MTNRAQFNKKYPNITWVDDPSELHTRQVAFCHGVEVGESRNTSTSGMLMVSIEPSEIEIDAPRTFLLGLELGYKNLETMRKHIKNCGESIESWPQWAKEDTGHITKVGKAIIIRAMMIAASQQEAKS